MIKLVNLSKYYYGNNSVALGLRKINLEFHKGEFVAITGESGSGKTTLLSTISGMLPYEEGEMYFYGKATSYYDEADWEEYRKNHIAFVFQNYNLIDSYTALENVMTSFLIQGEECEIAKEKSMELLKRVGIGEYATHRATELSSGQKQRLSIARALAKNTEVIVADEPTGNLDSENGRQIMELFSELSKEKLVITVTHNYEEAAPYVTRKIVIHDGEVEEDIQLMEISTGGTSILEEENEVMVSATKGAENGFLSKTAWLFALMNMKSRIGKSIFLTFFLWVAALANFLFLGNLIANLDDTNTKVYENSAFYNSDETRIVVRHEDGSAMTKEDMAYLQNLEHVDYVDFYSLVNDINYFSEKGVDYQVTYIDNRQSVNDPPTYKEEITLDQFDKFVRSSSGLEAEDLAYGDLPKSANDVVIYSEDESLLGTTFVCYFNNQRDWSKNGYIRLELTVCGLLKEPTEQLYFSEQLCQVLNNDAIGYHMAYSVKGNRKWQETRFYVDETLDLEKEQLATPSDVYLRYAEAKVIYLCLQELEGNNWLEEIDIDHSQTNEPIVVKEHISSSQFVAISQEMYDALFKDVYNTQIGVYVQDYAYLQDTLKEIRSAGYEAVAPFHIGSVSYDDAKVTDRLVTLGISVAAMLVLFLLEVMIVLAFIRNEKRSDLILKSIGMQQHTLTLTRGYALVCYVGIAFILMIISIFTIGRSIAQIEHLFIYYRFHHVILLFVISVSAMILTTWLYRRTLMKSLRAGSEVRVS